MPTGIKSRDIRLDAIRGMFLIIMAAVHVPTPLSHALQEPFGFVSDAEGFVFLSATLAGFIYGRIYREGGWVAMSRRAWSRARWVYLVHLALVVPLALIAWAAAGRMAPLANHFHDFLVHPWASLALLPLLLNQPPLFDILPLYVVLLGATPLLLALARRRGWSAILWISLFGWLAAQFKFDPQFIGNPSRLLPVCWGSFNFLAWQFLWVCGLALGETAPRWPTLGRPFRIAAGGVSLLVVVAGLLSRHGYWPQAWFSQDLYLWMDKWTLGPLRLLNFGAWVALLLAWNPSFSLPPFLAPVALLGRQSLAVFAFHLPLAIAATTTIQVLSLTSGSQTVIGLAVIAALFPWAARQERNDHRRRAQFSSAITAPAATAAPGPNDGERSAPASLAELPVAG